jgi:hypothetical protein
MSFPSKPLTPDGRRSLLLKLFSVEGHPQVFVLGSQARYVTIYAQQVRALNLVSALAKSGYFSRSTRLAVVGGGIAGLTAAAAAARAGVGHISVFEREPTVMRLQRNSEKRYVHPHIYDWPFVQEPHRKAELPVLDWEAGIAADVAKNLMSKFEAERQAAEGRLDEPRTGVRDLELRANGVCPGLRVDGEWHDFDVAVLAVGFGRDASSSTFGYWTDDDLSAIEHEKAPHRWLVSGYGDGALTDLMRLCIRDFRHESVLAAVDNQTRQRVGDQMLEAERTASRIGERAAKFTEIARAIDRALQDVLPFREVGEVFLNCDGESLFEPRSSILNRLIIAWLLENKRFTLLTPPGVIAGEPEKVGTGYRVRFEAREPLEFDRVIFRHGPKSIYQTEPWLASVWREIAPLQEAWRSAGQFEDWTREPMYDEEVSLFKTPASLRIQFGEQIGCVVVTGRHPLAGRSLADRVGKSLERLVKRKGTERYAPGRAVQVKPQEIALAEALSSTVHYERAVRALCDSEIAIFDLTGYESAAMLLLGIRSVVRRGVTVAVTSRPTPFLPFNVASLNPLLIDASYVENQARALEAGFTGLVTLPDRYLDLPAYDAVRSVGEDYRIRKPEEEILVLRWFDEQYARLAGDEILKNRLETEWRGSKVVTSLDSRSPQLVEQRLYAAIRRDRLCVADWTAARANVFFEIGVRLAVSENDPIFVLCEERPNGWNDDEKSRWPESQDPWLAVLERLFGVTRFSSRDSEALNSRLREYESTRAQGLLSRGRTYAVVSEAIDRTHEPGGQPIDSLLVSQAELLAGPAVEEGDVPVLYGEALKEQVRRAAAEHTLAAWYYLDGRFKIFEKMRACTLDRTDPVVERMQKVGVKFSSQLRGAPSELQEFAEEIRTRLRELIRYTKGGGSRG